MVRRTQSRADLAGLTAEEKRLEEDRKHQKYWRRWGPFLSERQWGAVREDYSFDGNAWESFTFDQSRSRTYRWGEDGLCGVSDNKQLLCFSLGLWNEQDSILKEKLFGLTGPQGNHGEDVKELYYYVDNTPTHSYMKYLYKYPQNKFPYEDLVKTNAERSKLEREYELSDTGIFENDEYFDVVFEMAKEDDEELYFRITAYNRSSKPAPLHILPQVFYRNTWSWGHDDYKPNLHQESENIIKVDHKKMGDNRRVVFAPSPGLTEQHPDVEAELIFTDNESNLKSLYNQPNTSDYVKDAFHGYIVDEKNDVINPELNGTKAGAWFVFDDEGGVPPGDYVTVRYKFTKKDVEGFDEHDFDQVFNRRENEADNFYWRITPLPISDELRQIQRQAFAGMLWTKQFYHFVQEDWFYGDPILPKAASNRGNGRNKEWKHMYINDVLSFCDKFEYSFFAAWDTAFHCIPLALIDPDFAKKQLDLLTREWYMHPNGQIPAYEWNFSDVNPPVHAWSTFRVYKLERKLYGRADDEFLERVFQKLLLNFTWWVNRKDTDGNNVFEGGFLGLDNIGIFNRSEPLPTGGTLEQADSTAWMAFFSLQMLNIALELAKKRPVYEDIASKFFEHFLLISDAMTFQGDIHKDENVQSLWNEDDEFYYDAITWDRGGKIQLPIRSLVGLIPLYASLTLEPQLVDKFPSFKKRMDWFIENRSKVANRNIASMKHKGVGERLLLALVDEDRLRAILKRMLDEDEFLSEYGIRSLSKFHKDHPYTWDVNGYQYRIDYLPGESDSGLFGGNSNWRGPIWFPTNFLLVESLQRFFLYYGPNFKIECPTNSGNLMNLAQVAEFVQHRLINLFTYDQSLGKRPNNGDDSKASNDPYFKDLVLSYEYFDGDTGRGLGASHQTGWTGLVAKMIHDTGITLSRSRRLSSAGSEQLSKTNDQNEDYQPKSGPFPGRLQRRCSTKSFLTLTSEILELSEEETNAHTINLRNKISSGLSSAALSRVSTVRSDGSTDEENDDEKLLVEQIRSAISKFQMNDDEDESEDEGGVSYDELEAGHDSN